MKEQHQTAGIIKPARAVFLPGNSTGMTCVDWIRAIIICLLLGAAVCLFLGSCAEVIIPVATLPALMADECK